MEAVEGVSAQLKDEISSINARIDYAILPQISELSKQLEDEKSANLDQVSPAS